MFPGREGAGADSEYPSPNSEHRVLTLGGLKSASWELSRHGNEQTLRCGLLASGDPLGKHLRSCPFVNT